jgi:hypothetical protein
VEIHSIRHRRDVYRTLPLTVSAIAETGHA